MTSREGAAIHVLLLTHYFEPEHGAPQRRWRAFIDELAGRGIEIDVIAPTPHHPAGRVAREHRAEYRPGSVRTDAVGARTRRVGYLPHDGGILLRTLDHLWVAVASVRGAARALRSRDNVVSVVVATAPALPTLVAGWVVAKRHGLPLVVEMRDAWPDLISYTPGLVGARSLKGLIKQGLHRGITRLQRRADAVVTTSERFAHVLRERGVECVFVIRNGTDPERYERVGPAQPHDGPLRVLYMGTVGRSQGLDTVVLAAAQLARLGVAIDVRIVGAGADTVRLRSLNERLGHPVELRSAVKPDEVLRHYRWADTCVVSLRDWEPFNWTVPSKLYELMATGKHLTALLAGEGAAIVRSTSSGLIVKPGDVEGLVRSWSALSTYREGLDVGEDGRRWVRENAAYSKLARQYMAVMREVSAAR